MSRRAFLLLAVLLIVIAPLTVKTKPASGSIVKPSVPEFTAKFVDRSYDVPETSSIDPYTGKSINNPGYHVRNYTIEVTIENQPFVPTDAGGWNTTLYYNVRFKGHYSPEWMTAYSPYNEYPKQSDSTHTVLTYTHSSDYEYVIGGVMTQIHLGAQVDFQVQALVGAVHRSYNPNATDQLSMYPWVFEGETSSWSSTQTVLIPAENVAPSPNGGPTSDEETRIEPFSFILGVAVTIVAVSVGVGLFFYRKKTKRDLKRSRKIASPVALSPAIDLPAEVGL
ncbi:TPA: hypothetical protein HA273_05475 [Candidatus Bathyarchaeota archaeon]|nr:hypothetical protein [Candidatus Bathyarchaeota archaeon]HIJ08806.1 hypothetical protein [Candidatus Bathyarchaeota archaeon]